MVVGGHFQTPHALGAQPWRERCDDCSDVPALQSLLERPQAIAPGQGSSSRRDNKDLVEIQPVALQDCRGQLHRRIEKDDMTGLRANKRRRKNPDLADTCARKQQLREAAAWPAAARQLRVERAKAARKAGVTVPAKLVS